MTLLLGAAAAALASCAAIWGLRPILAQRAADIPSARSSHTTPVPRAGGVGVVLGVLVGLLLTASMFDQRTLLVVAVLVVMALVGLAEDLRGLPVGLRLLAQVAVATGVVGILAGEVGPWPVLPLLVVALAGWCNAFNFMDGINGISGLSALVVLGWYVGVGTQVDASGVVVAAVVLAGAVAGFLPWNLPVARHFLGDTGSYSIGMALPVLGLVLRAEGASWVQVLAPLLVYGADVGWTLLDRIRRRQVWHEAHRDHVYQHVSVLLGHPVTAVLVASFSVVSCALAWWLADHVVALVACWTLLLATYLGQRRWWPHVAGGSRS